MKAYLAEVESCAFRLLEAFCLGLGMPPTALHHLFEVRWVGGLAGLAGWFGWVDGSKDGWGGWAAVGKRAGAAVLGIILVFWGCLTNITLPPACCGNGVAPAGAAHFLPAAQLLSGTAAAGAAAGG